MYESRKNTFPSQKFDRHKAAFSVIPAPTCSVEKCGSSSLTAALLNLVFGSAFSSKAKPE